MNRTPHAGSRDNTTRIFFVACGSVVGLWALAWLMQASLLPDWPARGQFGDMFGAVNSLFSGLAFAGVIVAILLQREDLRVQREELAATREELSRAAKAHEDARDLQRRRLYEEARYESWRRAANAIEAFRHWLFEWWSLIEDYKLGESPVPAGRHWSDPRRAELEAVLKATNHFFPGLFTTFEPDLKGTQEAMKVLIARQPSDQVMAIYARVGSSCDEWSKRVHDEVFADLIAPKTTPAAGDAA